MDINEPYNYVGISDKLKKKAQKELNENPEQVRSHIASLRRWLQSMPHIKNCRDDDKFLLRFLRIAKFDHSRAQTLLDNYCTVRVSERGSPEWFKTPDAKQLETYLTKGYMTLCGKNEEGELIIIENMADWDPDTFPMNDLMCCAYAAFDAVIADECGQISGMVVIMDCSTMNKKQMNSWQDPRVMFKAIRNWQDAYPIRTKAMVYWKEPLFFDVMFNVFKNLPFLKKKLKDRLHKCGTDMDKVVKHCGAGAEKVLPTDLGGKNGTLAEIREKTLDNWRKIIAQERELLANLVVDEKLRQPMTMNYLMSYDAKTMDNTMGVAGTYTKFDV